MDEVTQQQTRDRFTTLPEIVRTTITDPATYDTIDRIGLAQGLTRVEVGLLAQATSLLMMGFIEPNKYVSVLIDQLTISQEAAATIAQEINRDIFNVIKGALIEVHGINKSSTMPGVVTPPPAAQKTGPSSFALPNVPAASTPSSTSPSAVVVPAPSKVAAPISPSPLLAALDVAAMKADTIAPSAPVMTAPQVLPSPQAPQSASQAVTQEPMRTITMDQPRTPMMTPSTAPAGITAPVQSMPSPEQPSMNIFEEKLGTAFRMKSESIISTPNYTSPVVPSTPANPLPQAMPSATLPRPTPQPMIGVVPTPIAPAPRLPLAQTPVATPPAPAAAPLMKSVEQSKSAPIVPPPPASSDPYRESV